MNTKYVFLRNSALRSISIIVTVFICFSFTSCKNDNIVDSNEVMPTDKQSVNVEAREKEILRQQQLREESQRNLTDEMKKWLSTFSFYAENNLQNSQKNGGTKGFNDKSFAPKAYTTNGTESGSLTVTRFGNNITINAETFTNRPDYWWYGGVSVDVYIINSNSPTSWVYLTTFGNPSVYVAWWEGFTLPDGT